MKLNNVDPVLLNSDEREKIEKDTELISDLSKAIKSIKAKANQLNT